ncbi:hypothetical protein [Cellulomonas aerilata]|uniref:hypothetical protein n=1 Tax=Cellulomonas aerilata TaxID=515326 RepID=UPI001649C4BE|nr:hypothetical protein [Cellulomonas aerilata]
MDFYIGIGAVVVLAVLIVGLFHGPSHHVPRRPTRRSRSSPASPPQSGPVPPSTAPLVPQPGTPVEPGAVSGDPSLPGHTSPLPAEPPAYVMPPPRRRHLPRRPVGGPRGRRP